MEKSVNDRISDEIAMITQLFESVPPEQMTMAETLIQNAAFQKVTLEDLQAIINESGPVEEYQNGENQRGMKQSAAVQAYTSLYKNYAATWKELNRILAENKKPALPKVPEYVQVEYEDPYERAERINREIQEAVERQQRERGIIAPEA